MYSSQDLDALLSQGKNLWALQASEIVARQLVVPLRAAWAEATALEAAVIPMAFPERTLSEWESGDPESSATRSDKGFSHPWVIRSDKGSLHPYSQRGQAYEPWDVNNLGDLEDNPMGWLFAIVALKHRLTTRLDQVNRLVMGEAD